MNVEELVRETLRDQADGQPPAPPGFADRVLGAHRRRRTRRLASVAAATAAVAAIAVGVPLLDSAAGTDARPSRALDSGEVRAHPDQSPPRDRIGAGDTVLAAYYTAELQQHTGKRGVAARTYWLLDPKTGKYEKDARWSFVAVAPGLKTAAVLERNLPAHRIGLLDLATGEVERWIPVGHGVGGLAFSYDGTRLLATTYGENPDLRVKERLHDEDGKTTWMWGTRFGDSSRSGFYDLDVASGTGSWSPVAPDRDLNSRADFAYSRNARSVYAQYIGGRDGLQQFYDLEGHRTAPPADEKFLRSDVPARLSPSGRLAALGLTKEVAGNPGKSYSSVRDPRTGKEITKVRGGHLLAWADDKHLIAWERVTSLEEEYRPRLVLVTIGSDQVVPLSGVQEPNRPDALRESWQPVFARR